MLPSIEYLGYKALEAYCRVRHFRPGFKSERGQSTAEYVAVTAVAVGLGITIVAVLLGDSLQEAATTVGDQIKAWADDIDGPGE